MMNFLRWLAGDCGRDLPMALLRSATLGIWTAFSVALYFQTLHDAMISGVMYGYLSACVWTSAIQTAVEERNGTRME